MDAFIGWIVFIGFLAFVWWGVRDLWNEQDQQAKGDFKENEHGYGSERHKHYVAHDETHGYTPTRRNREGKELGGTTLAAAKTNTLTRRRSSQNLFGKQSPLPRREPEQRPVTTEDSNGTETLVALGVGAAIGALLSSKSDEGSGCSPGSSFSGGGGDSDGGGASSSYESSSSDSGSSSSDSSSSSSTD